MLRKMSVVGLCGIALAATGCGGPSYELAAVSGQVTCGGEPVPGGQLQFVPVNENLDKSADTPPASFALIDIGGNYTIPNVVVGKHTVTFLRPNLEEIEEASSNGEDDDPEDGIEAIEDIELAKQLNALPCGNVDDPDVEVASGENVIDIELGARRTGKRGRSRGDDDDEDD